MKEKGETQYHYYLDMNFDDDPSSFRELNGKYEVFEIYGYHSVVSYAAIRKEVTCPVAGAAIFNPNDKFNSKIGGITAFKRAVLSYITLCFPNWSLSSSGKKYLMKKFREARYFKLAELGIIERYEKEKMETKNDTI